MTELWLVDLKAAAPVLEALEQETPRLSEDDRRRALCLGDAEERILRGLAEAKQPVVLGLNKVDSLKDKLSRAYFVDKNSLNTNSVVFGTRVRVKDLDMGDEETFDLVGPGDEDYDNNKILTTSPVGQGLLGKKKGEVAEISVPMGKLRFEILEISIPE